MLLEEARNEYNKNLAQSSWLYKTFQENNLNAKEKKKILLETMKEFRKQKEELYQVNEYFKHFKRLPRWQKQN